jgi:hypothetical protein
MTEAKPTQLTPAAKSVARQIAAALGETLAVPVDQIRRIVEVLGADQAWALLKKTEVVQTEGGLNVKDGSRARSKGGVFFQLARQTLDPAGRRYVWPSRRPSNATKAGGQGLVWSERLAIITQLRRAPGEVRTAKLTLIGRPGRVVVKDEVVLISLPSLGKQPTLPRELPQPPTVSTSAIVYVALKQWRPVEAALTDPKDRLIVEGFPALDGRLKALTVYATNLTTVALQRAKHAR